MVALLAMLLGLKKSQAQNGKDYDYSIRLEKITFINRVTKDTTVGSRTIVITKRANRLMIFDPIASHDQLKLVFDGWNAAGQWLAYLSGTKVIYVQPQVPMVQILDPLALTITIYQ